MSAAAITLDEDALPDVAAVRALLQVRDMDLQETSVVHEADHWLRHQNLERTGECAVHSGVRPLNLWLALQCVPSEDEARLLAAFRRNDTALAGLADAELFCLDLMTVGCCRAWL